MSSEISLTDITLSSSENSLARIQTQYGKLALENLKMLDVSSKAPMIEILIETGVFSTTLSKTDITNFNN